MNTIFKTNPQLEKVYMTTDGEAFYQEHDAKNYAKTLEVKTVEVVYNPNFIEVIEDEEEDDASKEMKEFEASEKEVESPVVESPVVELPKSKK